MTGPLLLTGASGFVGQYVAKAVRADRYPMQELLALPSGCDLRDSAAISAFVRQNKPGSVLHLAAQSFVPQSIANPRETFDVNVMGTLNLIEALEANGFDGKFLYVSSGDVYGLVAEESLPVGTNTSPAPGNPYAASKLAAEELCLQWGRRTGVEILVARPFNHIGPGQDARFVIASFAAQLTAIRRGELPPVLDVGDIEVTRDFTDVRDVVDAYAKIFEHGEPGTRYLIASGIERRIRDILAGLIQIVGVEVEVRRDPNRYRMADQRRMVASAAATTKDTGWIPIIKFEQTLNDILYAADKK